MNNPFLKRRRKEAIKVLIAQIVILVLFVGLWELLSSLEIIDAFLFSKPSRIVKLLKTYIITKTIYKHIGISLLETLLGLVIGTLAGLLIAIILWWNKIIAKIIFPLVKPAMSTVMILSFQGAWTNTLASNLYLDNETYKTFAYYMSTLSTGGTVSTAGVAAAGTLIMFLPNLIIFVILQSGVMNTMAHSGIK